MRKRKERERGVAAVGKNERKCEKSGGWDK